MGPVGAWSDLFCSEVSCEQLGQNRRVSVISGRGTEPELAGRHITRHDRAHADHRPHADRYALAHSAPAPMYAPVPM